MLENPPAPNAYHMPQDTSFDVFLCHSTHDMEWVIKVYKTLRAEGLRVYIDWMVDRANDNAPCHASLAGLLKMRMRASHRLLYLRTPNGNLSRWCAWEIGFFDAIKPTQVFVADLTQTPRANFLLHYPRWPHRFADFEKRATVQSCPNMMIDCSTSTASTQRWTA